MQSIRPAIPLGRFRRSTCWIDIQMPEHLRLVKLPYGFVGDNPAA